MQNFLSFIVEIDKLKNVERRTRTFHSDRLENSAEHSWHLALATLILASEEKRSDLDLFKAVKMALLHDLVEIYSGDTFHYHAGADKFPSELKSAKQIFSLLAEPMQSELLALWLEFEKKETAEAQFVGALDRFLPIYANCKHDGFAWKNHGITYDQVMEKNKNAIATGSPNLWTLIKAKIDAGKAKFFQ